MSNTHTLQFMTKRIKIQYFRRKKQKHPDQVSKVMTDEQLTRNVHISLRCRYEQDLNIDLVRTPNMFTVIPKMYATYLGHKMFQAQ